MFCKKGDLTNFAKFTRKVEEVEDLQSLTLSKKEIPGEMISCEFCEISHNAFFKGTLMQI